MIKKFLILTTLSFIVLFGICSHYHYNDSFEGIYSINEVVPYLPKNNIKPRKRKRHV